MSHMASLDSSCGREDMGETLGSSCLILPSLACKQCKQREGTAMAFCTVKLVRRNVGVHCIRDRVKLFVLPCERKGAREELCSESPVLPGAPPGVVPLHAAPCKTEPEGLN